MILSYLLLHLIWIGQDNSGATKCSIRSQHNYSVWYSFFSSTFSLSWRSLAGCAWISWPHLSPCSSSPSTAVSTSSSTCTCRTGSGKLSTPSVDVLAANKVKAQRDTHRRNLHVCKGQGQSKLFTVECIIFICPNYWKRWLQKLIKIFVPRL